MKRQVGAVALMIVAIGATAGCAEYTTTGVPEEPSAVASEVGESLAPQTDPLVGTSWVLESSTTESSDLTEFPITATFSEGTMSGRGPVNQYTAPYTVESDTMTIGPVASTKMAGDPAAMAAEGAYFALLEQVSGVEVSTESLQLLAGDEAVLVWRPDPASAQPSPDPAAEQEAATKAVADSIVGEPAATAQRTVEEAGLAWRVLSEDGTSKPATSDYNPSRVNVDLVDGKVTQASVG